MFSECTGVPVSFQTKTGILAGVKGEVRGKPGKRRESRLYRTMQVSLRFGANGCDSEAPELSRISIAMAANDEPRVFVRGQLAFGQSHGTFPWTSGVHALSLLFLEAAIRQITDGNGSVESETFCQSTEPQLLGPHLIGERGSPATTLDFALSKRPAWLLELFGATTSGASVLSRYVVVKNSNGKRPGPTEIWLKPAVNVQIVDPSSTGPLSTAELKELLAQLHKNWKPYGVRKVASRSLPASKAHYKTSDQATVGSSPQSFKDVLCKLYEPELSQCLEAFDPFNARSYKQQLERLVTDSSFKKLLAINPLP
jgi:hypothetical protein